MWICNVDILNNSLDLNFRLLIKNFPNKTTEHCSYSIQQEKKMDQTRKDPSRRSPIALILMSVSVWDPFHLKPTVPINILFNLQAIILINFHNLIIVRPLSLYIQKMLALLVASFTVFVLC